MAGRYFSKFPVTSIFYILHEVKSREPAKFQQDSMLAQCVRITVKLLCHKTPNFIIGPNLWLLDISGVSPVDYRIFAMLREWVCQRPVQYVDKL